MRDITVGEYQFKIRPFGAKDATYIFGDVASIILPILGTVSVASDDKDAVNMEMFDGIEVDFLISPYKGTFRVSQAYRNLRANGTYHQGYDLVGIGDKSIYCPVYGTVIRAGWECATLPKKGFGQRVVVRIGSTAYYMYFGHAKTGKMDLV